MSDDASIAPADDSASLPTPEGERAEHVGNYYDDIVRSTERWARTLVIAIKREDWKGLGYRTKQEYIQRHSNPNRMQVASPLRRELAQLLRTEADLTTREIGAALGTSAATAMRDLSQDETREEESAATPAGQGGEPPGPLFQDETAAQYDDVADAAVRQVEAREREPEPVITPDLPPDRYRAIVIDPPWPMQKIEREERPDQGRALDYPTMGLDEIGGLPVPDLADPAGCHIYLWVTHKFLPAGLELFDAWDTRYQCTMTWVKNVGITPYSWMYSTEHVLFGRIGNLQLDKLGIRLDFAAPTQGHSRKPDVFYDRVRLASPGPRLELFARQTREGFEAWGNEVASAEA